MKIGIESYAASRALLPQTGQHILAHQHGDQLVVYQAYKPAIARFAVANQALGGPDFSYDRMSWIKPNFLWMMYRCGWGSKENQERILAFWLRKPDFEAMLREAAFSTFAAGAYATHEEWRQALGSSKVRLQWDPDHDPHGNKLARRAIQLGLKGEVLKRFGQQQITLVEDVTEFVRQQKQFVDNKALSQLLVPIERPYTVSDPAIAARIRLDIP